jgi:hypothetical protein
MKRMGGGITMFNGASSFFCNHAYFMPEKEERCAIFSPAFLWGLYIGAGVQKAINQAEY